MTGGSCSDAIMLANTFDCWVDARRAGRESAWCDANFVSWRTMKVISETREHLRSALESRGLGSSQNFSCELGPARRLVLLRAAICAAHWPSVGVVAGSELNRSKDGTTSRRLVMHGRDNMGLRAHPGSTASGLTMFQLGRLKIAMCVPSRAAWLALRSEARAQRACGRPDLWPPTQADASGTALRCRLAGTRRRC